MAKPREPPAQTPEAFELPPARPAPVFKAPKITPRHLRRSTSEAFLMSPTNFSSEGSPLQHMESVPVGKRKVFKLSASQSELHGLSTLLQRASMPEAANPPLLKVHQFTEEWSYQRRSVPVRTKKSQNSYVDARLHPKSTGVKAGSAADLTLRLEQARQERLRMERELQEGGMCTKSK
eukprot:TRINITY_DN18720_c0_g1_i2.p2 TRINITY_DN18720_c0_g1~~TRINITY_DN18720_c0_g1_i2.p2  ORF type:complete len:178 (+),score=25.47 TRINITY_DN18720_c0_g1_i2:671-1204(+)